MAGPSPHSVCAVTGALAVDRVARPDEEGPELCAPPAKTLAVPRLEGGGYAILAGFGEELLVRAEPFDAVELDLQLSFSR